MELSADGSAYASAPASSAAPSIVTNRAFISGSGHGRDGVEHGATAADWKNATGAPPHVRGRAVSREVGAARGVLRPAQADGVFHHARLAPSAMLEPLVQHYWSVRWDLGDGAPQVRETLPHPNVHLVVERGGSRIYGVHTGRFTTTLAGRGEVFGVKFRAGGFRGLLGAPVSTLRDRSMAPEAVFGAGAAALEAEILAQRDDAGRVAVAEDFLRRHAPSVDADGRYAASIVDGIAASPEIACLEDLLACWPASRRGLQRLFSDHVGVGPKWVIKRYRLHEALERIARAQTVDWAALALELGYYDQAHFIRDFKALVGRAPAEYRRASAPPR